MSTWGWVAAFYALAVAIAGGATWFGRRAGSALSTAFRDLFATVEQRRTFMGLPVILHVARRDRWVLVIVVFASAPSLAAIALAVAGAPVDLWRTLLPWQGASTATAVATYGVIAVVFGLGCLWHLRVTRAEVAAGGIETPALLRERSPVDVARRLAGGSVVDEGGLLEELGWRAFLLPLLLLELDRGPATLLLALMWWSWHLPREVPGWRRLPSHRLWAKNQLVFIATCVGLSVLCTEAVLLTGGSVWPAVLIHGGTNVWSKALGTGPYARYSTDVRTVIVSALAALVVVSRIF